MHSIDLGIVQDTMMLGSDYYETDEERAALIAAGKVPMGIGENTKIRFLFQTNLLNSPFLCVKFQSPRAFCI